MSSCSASRTVAAGACNVPSIPRVARVTAVRARHSALSSRGRSLVSRPRGIQQQSYGGRRTRLFVLRANDVTTEAQEASATEEEKTVEETESAELEKPASSPAQAVTEGEAGAPKPKAPRRRSKKPRIQLEELQEGQLITGKVTSVTAYGAFVDFGAKNDGLIHISQLSHSFVRDVNDVVQVGQELECKILSVDLDKGRTSLSLKGLREDDTPQEERAPGRRPRGDKKQGDGADDMEAGSPKPTGKVATREVRKPRKPKMQLKKGQKIKGVVDSIANFGVFVKVGEDTVGLLHRNEMPTSKSANLEESFPIGEEIEVKVVEARGNKIDFSIKEKTDYSKINEAAIANLPPPTSVFEEALRKVGVVVDKESLEKAVSVEIEQAGLPDAAKEESTSETPSPEDISSEAGAEASVVVTDDAEEAPAAVQDEEDESPSASAEAVSVDEAATDEFEDKEDAPEPVTEAVAEPVIQDTAEPEIAEPVAAEEPVAAAEEPVAAAEEPVAEVEEPVAAAEEPVAEVEEPVVAAEEPVAEVEEPVVAAEEPVAEIEEPVVAAEEPEVVSNSVVQTPEPVAEEDTTEKKEETPASVKEEAPKPVEVEAAKADVKVEEPAVEEASAQQEPPAVVVEAAKAEPSASDAPKKSDGVSAKDVKILRAKTGAGMMDCKKALAAAGGDIETAVTALRQKGLASAEKKASRVAAEGAIVSYIHTGSRLGVLMEVNCETDFVARGDAFRSLAQNMAMQVAACPDVQVVRTEDVDPEFIAKEREVEMGKEDLQSKPEQFRAKIVDGRISKRLKELALTEQDYIRDNSKVVNDVVKETVAQLGENIQIRRFIRFNLGEGLEKREDNFAEEVAAQAQKQAAPKKEEKPAPEPAAESKKEEAPPAAPAVAVKAADVKTLRAKTGIIEARLHCRAGDTYALLTRESRVATIRARSSLLNVGQKAFSKLKDGAGMMDCKKALAAADGDIDAAVTALRQKGLAAADKKSKRIAAEGVIGSYIHAGSRLGVLVEVNCETDFVARGEQFQQLVRDMAMQIAASPQVEYVKKDDVDQAWVERETAVEMGKEDLQSKPEAMREKIVSGRINKRLSEVALMDQAYIKDTTKNVSEIIKEAIATLGENIQIRRFERFVLGEGIEKRQEDFAAEVAKQTGQA